MENTEKVEESESTESSEVIEETDNSSEQENTVLEQNTGMSEDVPPPKKKKMKTSAKVVITICVVLVAVIIATCIATPFIAFNFIFKRPSRSTEIPDYYIGTPHYNVSQAGLKIMKNSPSEDAYIESRDGLNLHAYMFPAEEGPETKRFVLSIHGYRSYSRPEFAPFFEFYHSLGFNCLLPDDRAHAPSEGDYIGFGVLDRFDCVDWAKYLVKTYGEDIEIILHGVSMGGATVLSAAGEEDLPKQVVGIVSDCAFSNAWDVIDFQLKEIAHLPSGLILPWVEKLNIKKQGFNFHDNSPVEQVKNAKVPIFFAHGEKDMMVPFEMVHELYDACPTEKRILTVPEAAHGECIAFEPEAYYRNIIELFNLQEYVPSK